MSVLKRRTFLNVTLQKVKFGLLNSFSRFLFIFFHKKDNKCVFMQPWEFKNLLNVAVNFLAKILSESN